MPKPTTTGNMPRRWAETSASVILTSTPLEYVTRRTRGRRGAALLSAALPAGRASPAAAGRRRAAQQAPPSSSAAPRRARAGRGPIAGDGGQLLQRRAPATCGRPLAGGDPRQRRGGLRFGGRAAAAGGAPAAAATSRARAPGQPALVPPERRQWDHNAWVLSQSGYGLFGRC
ncbi:unnamed protein product [Prorocentrum cordatum]|uniref:Uncharacterized protein n=1 Tax=Prorocentrum cordatum TaxID=2364126 RepID=A0ABN9RFP4_9DINO|nr:unnamed protein product [Polarella glacialis]